MVLVGANWTEINYWSNSIGNNVSAQIRLLGKSTQSVSANTSRIDFKWQKRLTGSGSAYNNNTYPYSMTMTGHSASWNMTLGTVTSTSWVDIGETADYWSGIAHNADGTCSITYTASGYRFNGTAFSESGTITLPTIPRASKATVSPNPLTVGNTLTINTNRASSSFTHTVVITVGDYSYTMTNVGDSATWNASELVMMPYMDTWQKTGTVAVTTYSGANQIGSVQTTTFTLQVNTTKYKPVITFGTFSDADSTTSALETAGTYIKDYSQLSVPITARVNLNTYGETIRTLSVTLGNVTRTETINAESGTLSFLATVSTATLTATATDSRGYSVTETRTLTLVDYEPITISSVEIERVNQNGDQTETGEYLSYKIKGKAFLGSFGQAVNTIRVATASKLASASSYGAWVVEQTVTTQGAGYADYEITGITVGTYSASTQYDVIFGLQDALSPASSGAVRVHEGVPVAAWGADHFDVYGTFHIHDRDDVTKYVSIDHNGGGLSGILKTQWFTSASVTCTANWAGNVDVSVTVPTGYTFVGVIAACSNGNVVPCYCNSGLVNGVVSVWWRNPTGSNMNATFSVNVLFIRT